MSAKTQASVLGRGVGALLADDLELENNDRFFLCDIDKIIPNPDQPRKNFDTQQLQHLADSIKEKGVIQPLLVTRGTGNRYNLVAGERRLRASRMAGRTEVPVFVMEDGGKGDSFETALIENVVRHDLNPIEEARAYSRLLDEFGLTQEEVANRVGKKRTTITNTLRLLGLPDSIQQNVIDNVLTEGHARVLLRLKDDVPRMLEVRDRILQDRLSVRQTENACEQKKSSTTANTPSPARTERGLPAAYCQTLTVQLGNRLHSRVHISQQGARGKIEIDYYSSDDLDRLVSLLMGEDL